MVDDPGAVVAASVVASRVRFLPGPADVRRVGRPVVGAVPCEAESRDGPAVRQWIAAQIPANDRSCVLHVLRERFRAEVRSPAVGNCTTAKFSGDKTDSISEHPFVLAVASPSAAERCCQLQAVCSSWEDL